MADPTHLPPREAVLVAGLLEATPEQPVGVKLVPGEGVNTAQLPDGYRVVSIQQVEFVDHEGEKERDLIRYETPGGPVIGVRHEGAKSWLPCSASPPTRFRYSVASAGLWRSARTHPTTGALRGRRPACAPIARRGTRRPRAKSTTTGRSKTRSRRRPRPAAARSWRPVRRPDASNRAVHDRRIDGWLQALASNAGPQRIAGPGIRHRRPRGVRDRPCRRRPRAALMRRASPMP
jgi:hypothetical protein